ncbi:MAG: biotin/lipoyl-containing protein, partial [Spirochaetia bacterium]
MKLDIKVPSVGESVTQGILASWLKAEGDHVEEGSDLFELETDKATVTVPAPATGSLSISVAAGAEVTIGQVVGAVDVEKTAAASRSTAKSSAAQASAPRYPADLAPRPPAGQVAAAPAAPTV